MRTAPLPLTLRQLQYVVAVAEERSFRGAARRCFVSQPSLSAQVAEAERALGVRLFERDRGGVLLTAAGAELVARAQRVLLDTEDLLESARRHGDPLARTLRLGVIPTVGPYLLPEITPALRRSYPRLTLVWTEDRTAVLVDAITRGAMDGAVLALEADLGDLEHAVLGIDRFLLAAAASHPLASGRRPVRLDELEDERVLLLDEGHCLREQALTFCTRAGAHELDFRATSLATLVQMVDSGVGITLLPELAVAAETRRSGLRVRPFREPSPSRTLVAVWRRGSPVGETLGPIAKTIAAALDGGRRSERHVRRGRAQRP